MALWDQAVCLLLLGLTWVDWVGMCARAFAGKTEDGGEGEEPEKGERKRKGTRT